MSKKFEMTGSPKNAMFSTKAVIVELMSDFGWEQAKMTKKNNQVDFLICDDMDAQTSKMQLAKELNVEIMTYSDLAAMFDLVGDM